MGMASPREIISPTLPVHKLGRVCPWTGHLEPEMARLAEQEEHPTIFRRHLAIDGAIKGVDGRNGRQSLESNCVFVKNLRLYLIASTPLTSL